MSEKELMTNIKQTETYTLPSGQEVEQENILYTVSRIDTVNKLYTVSKFYTVSRIDTVNKLYTVSKFYTVSRIDTVNKLYYQ